MKIIKCSKKQIKGHSKLCKLEVKYEAPQIVSLWSTFFLYFELTDLQSLDHHLDASTRPRGRAEE